jgi:hypothetical protein
MGPKTACYQLCHAATDKTLMRDFKILVQNNLTYCIFMDKNLVKAGTQSSRFKLILIFS